MRARPSTRARRTRFPNGVVSAAAQRLRIRLMGARRPDLGQPIGRDDLVDEVMRGTPEVIRVFLEFRMGCVGCPIGAMHTVTDAAFEHNVDSRALLDALNAAARLKASALALLKLPRLR